MIKTIETMSRGSEMRDLVTIVDTVKRTRDAIERIVGINPNNASAKKCLDAADELFARVSDLVARATLTPLEKTEAKKCLDAADKLFARASDLVATSTPLEKTEATSQRVDSVPFRDNTSR